MGADAAKGSCGTTAKLEVTAVGGDIPIYLYDASTIVRHGRAAVFVIRLKHDVELGCRSRDVRIQINVAMRFDRDSRVTCPSFGNAVIQQNIVASLGCTDCAELNI